MTVYLEMFQRNIKTQTLVLSISKIKRDLGEQDELSVKGMNKMVLDYVIRDSFEYPDGSDLG